MSKNSNSGSSAKGSSAKKAKAAEAIEEIKLAGNQLVDRVRDLIEEGNVRHIRIKKEGRVLLEVPMTVGVGAGAAAVLLSPMLAALGALAALVTDVTLVIERDPDADTESGSTSSGSSSSGSSSGSSGNSGTSGGSSSSSGGSGGGDKASGKPTETSASKPVTDKDSPDKTIGK